MNTDELGSRAEFLTCALVSDVGSRPAGSEKEKQALHWIQEHLAGKGYAFSTESFRFASPPAFFPYYTAVGAAFILSAVFAPGFPWLALAMPVLVAALPAVYNWIIWKMPRRAFSENLLVLPENCSIKQVDLLLCAHVDTARGMSDGYGSRFFIPLRKQIFPIMQRTALILALTGVIYVMGIRLSSGVQAAAVSISAIVAFVLAVLDLWDQLGSRGSYTAGANDNASGVGVLMALAEHLTPDRFKRLNIGFLFTGAEEAGLWGARHFARRLTEAGLRPPVICVDMVGAGSDLRIVDGAKSFGTVKTDPEINGWLERADPLAVHHTALRRSSDFEAFIREGIPAGWIEGSGTPASWRAYHTLRDQPGLMDGEMLGRAAVLLARLVERMDRSK